MSIKNTVICNHCEGRGGFGDNSCTWCEGTGIIDLDLPPCEECSGRGVVLGEKYKGQSYYTSCRKCRGTGRTRKDNIVTTYKAPKDMRKLSARYDLIEPRFLEALARLMAKGAEKHGDYGYKTVIPQHDPVFINHLFQHLQEYQMKTPHDHSGDLKTHLVAIAANAMMEYYHCEQMEPNPNHPIED